MDYLIENLQLYTAISLVILLVSLILVFFKSSRETQEWERRIIIVVFFFTVHELAFFMGDMFISLLTEMLFVIGLLYALLYVFSFERKLKDMEDERKEFLSGLEEIRSIKEIREQLKK